MRKLFLALVFLITLYSCKQSEELDITLGDTTVSLSFNVNDADGDPSVKSHSGFTTAESTVDNIWVLQFDNTKGTLAIAPKYISEIINSKVEVELEKGGNQTIFLVANTCVEDLYSALDVDTYTLAQFNASDFSTSNAITAKRIPMLGKVVGSISDGGGIEENSPGDGIVNGYIVLNRLFAKVTLTYTVQDLTGTAGLNVASIELKNVPKSAKITRTSYPGGTDNQEEEILAGSKLQSYPIVTVTPSVVTGVTDKKGTLVFYMPQNFGGVTANTESIKKDGTGTTSGTYMEIKCTHTDHPGNTITYTTYLGGNITNNYNIYSNVTYSYNVTVGGLTESDRVDYDIPVVSTKTATSLSATGATLNGYLEVLGNKGGVKAGIRYKKTTGGEYNNDAGASKAETGVFETAISGLVPNTAYTFRAFATYAESEGTPVYGIEGTFTTLIQVKTTASPAQPAAGNLFTTLEGTVEAGGNANTITAKGIVYSRTNTAPEIGGNDVTNIVAANLTAFGAISEKTNTLYFGSELSYRAYATSAGQTTYGPVERFTPITNTGVYYSDNATYSLPAVKIGTNFWAPVNCGYSEAYPDGLFYQWGHKKGWDGTDVTGWDADPAPEGSWADDTKTNTDPCPLGWRVPTNTQHASLGHVEGSVTVSPLAGEKMTITCSNSEEVLTLPGCGRLTWDDGEMERVGTRGYYWASTFIQDNAYSLYWDFANSKWDTSYASSTRSYGFSVRCVKQR